MSGAVNSAPADVGEIYANEVGQIYTKPIPPKMHVEIREDAWRKLCGTFGFHNDIALGAELGVSPTTVWRIRTRLSNPGIGFCLQAMRIFRSSFEDLFEIKLDKDEEQAAA